MDLTTTWRGLRQINRPSIAGVADMAKRKKPSSGMGGPFLTGAIICMDTMQDSSGNLSAVNILDTLTMALPPQIELPTEAKPFQIPVNMLIMFKRGDSPEKHKLNVKIEPPGGKPKEVMSENLKFPPGSNAGINVKTRVAMSVHSSGVFWFDVYLDGKRMTRVPLKIVIAQTTPTGDAEKKPPKRTKSKAMST